MLKFVFILATRMVGITTCKLHTLSVAQKSLLASTLCVALCVVPLVVCSTLSDSVIGGMTNRIIHLSSGVLAVYTRAASMGELEDIAAKLKKFPLVKSATPEISTNALAIAKSKKHGVYLRGVPKNLFLDNPYYNAGKNSFIKILSGDVKTFGGKNVVIAQKLSEELGVTAGDKIKIVTMEFDENNKPHPKLSIYKIAAVISSGYEELDNLWLFVSLDGGTFVNNLLHNDTVAASPTVALDVFESDISSNKIFSLRDEINKEFRGFARAFLWSEVNAAQFENFSSTKLLLTFVMLIIVFVSTIFIATSLIMLVHERKKEIFILQSFGTNTILIAISFLIVSLIITMAALAVGIPVGVAISLNIEKIIGSCDILVNFLRGIFCTLSGSTFYPSHIMDKAYYLTDIKVTIESAQIFTTIIAVTVLSSLTSITTVLKATKNALL